MLPLPLTDALSPDEVHALRGEVGRRARSITRRRRVLGAVPVILVAVATLAALNPGGPGQRLRTGVPADRAPVPPDTVPPNSEDNSSDRSGDGSTGKAATGAARDRAVAVPPAVLQPG